LGKKSVTPGRLQSDGCVHSGGKACLPFFKNPSISLAEREGDEVVYVAAKLKDVASSAAQVHGWNEPAAVNVNIANIPMPTAEERAEMRALDRTLDAFAAMLRR
jgi:hypothetical protein